MLSPSARPRLQVVRAPAPEATTPPYDSDADLVEGVRSGNTRCKERIYLKHVDYVAGMCTRLLRSVEASEDVVQDTFVIAFSKIDSLRDAGAFRGWLASIAISQVRRRLGRQRLLRFLGLDGGLDDAPLDELAREDLSVEARSELAALDHVLQQLPHNHRIAWMLRYVEDEPLDAIAEACRCSRATVKRWIASANDYVSKFVDIRTEGEPS